MFYGKHSVLCMYDFFILKYNHETPDRWIIQDADGTIRVWDKDYPECRNELFFGKSYSAIHSIRGVLRPAFQMAVDDDILRKNPFEFQLATVVVNDSVTREAITKKEEKLFLEFVRNDKHYSKYYDGMYILFKTGMRISEFTGLTLRDENVRQKSLDPISQFQCPNCKSKKFNVTDSEHDENGVISKLFLQCEECGEVTQIDFIEK